MVINKKQSGFTLIELLAVIGIITVLSTLGIVAARYALNNAKDKKAGYDCAAIARAIQFLGNDTGSWPGGLDVNSVAADDSADFCVYTVDNCLHALSDNEAGLIGTDGSYIGWDGLYMPSLPNDPWGEQYFFDGNYQVKSDNTPCAGAGGCLPAVVVGSYGPNKQGHNSYEEDDIIFVLYK